MSNLTNLTREINVLSTNLSIDNAIRKAESLFNENSQDLVKVATNIYEPYSHFKAPDKNIYKKFIDEKNIPMLGNKPNLLLHNLPKQCEKGLTDYDSFKKHIEENVAHSAITVILGTSGCGKTRLCFETLCHNYGLYLVAFSDSIGSFSHDSIGSIDLNLSAKWASNNIINKQPEEAEILAERAVMSCIIGRLLLLQHLFCIAEQHNTIMAPKSWLILQLRHTIIKDLYLIFQKVTDLASIKLFCNNIIENIKDKFTKIFPIVYDEAQFHTTYLLTTSPSIQFNQEKAKSFFSIVVQSLSSLCYLITGAVVCITGSGLSLLRVKDEISLMKEKDELHVSIFNQFGQIETSDKLFELAGSIFPLEKEHALFAIKWLKGRYRWSWIWINYLITSEIFDPKEQLKILINNLTTKSNLNREYSICKGFAELEKYPSKRPTSINGTSTLEVIKSAIIFYVMIGRPIMFAYLDEVNIMSLGFSHIKNAQKLVNTIDEPLVIQAGFNYFEKESNKMWFQIISQVHFNAEISDPIWKKCVANFLRQKLFENNTALSESKMFFVKTKIENKEKIINYPYLPKDFEKPPQLLPYGDKCIGQISVDFTTADNYLGWLKAVAKWEKTGNVPEDFCPICYPPNIAGPDISIAFYFPKVQLNKNYKENNMQLDNKEHEENNMQSDEEYEENNMQLDEEYEKYEEQKSYILNVQVKLREMAIIKKSLKTVEPKLMFMDKNRNSNPPKANDMLCKIYKEQNWFDRNVKMIIVYPCNSKKKRQYQQISDVSKRKQAIPRVIIDMENASILFPEDFQKWIEVFKKRGENWDCSDIEESDDE